MNFMLRMKIECNGQRRRSLSFKKYSAKSNIPKSYISLTKQIKSIEPSLTS